MSSRKEQRKRTRPTTVVSGQWSGGAAHGGRLMLLDGLLDGSHGSAAYQYGVSGTESRMEFAACYFGRFAYYRARTAQSGVLCALDHGSRRAPTDDQQIGACSRNRLLTKRLQ